MHLYRIMIVAWGFLLSAPQVWADEPQQENDSAATDDAQTADELQSKAGKPDKEKTEEEKVVDKAVQAFQRGTYHFDHGEFKLAADAFREADRLRPNWKLLYNLAQSEAAAKRYGLALEAFEAYLVRGGDEVPSDRKVSVLHDIEQFRQLVGAVEIVAPDGAEVLVDGVVRGIAPLSGMVLVAAGIDHRVKVRKDGALYSEQTVKVSGSAERKIDLSQRTVFPETGEEASPQPMIGTEYSSSGAPETKPARNNGMFVSGLTLIGVGGAALVAGAVTGALALGKDSELAPICEENGCPYDKRGEVQKMEDLALSTNVLLAVGGTAAVAGVVLTVLSKKRGGDGEHISVAPIVGPTVAGGAFTWRF